MFNREQKIIELSEKKFTLENLVWLYKDGRIHFPQRAMAKRGRNEIVSNLIKAIRIGIPMPVMYVSELQNGDFLILEAEDQLMYLLSFIQGDFYIEIEGMTQGSGRYNFYELEEADSKLAGMIMRTVFIFQIIDFRTPKYLHMEVGLFHEKWNVNREQAIRAELYSGSDMEILQDYMKQFRYAWNMGTGSLQSEYIMLYMMLFWGVYKDFLSVDGDMSEQELLDAVISELFNERYRWLDYLKVLDSCFAYQNFIRGRSTYYMRFRDLKYMGKLIGLFACYYDMCQYTGSDVERMVYDLFEDKSFMNDIRTMRVTLRNIEKCLYIGRNWVR